ncbi:hypothetical protein JCM30566_08010 [Marinitoga arctica]
MKKKNLKTLLFNRVLVIMSFLILILILSVILSTSILFKNIYQSTIDNAIIFTNRIFNEGLTNFDYVSNQANIVVEELLDKIYKIYSKNDFLREYEKIKIEYLKPGYINDINYYIINSSGEIKETDYLSDLGINLSQRIPKYWEKLNKILKEKGEYIENLSFEIKTNNPRIYGYKLLDNGNILEIGLLLNENSFFNVFRKIQSLKFNFVDGIYTYNISFVPFSPQFPLLTENEKKIFNQLDFFKGNIKEYNIVEQSNGRKAYIYLKWQPEKKYEFSVLTKIEINFSEYISLRNFIFIIIVILISIFLFVFSLYLKRSADEVERPLLKLIEDIEKGKMVEVESGVIEIDTLIKYYSHMVSNLIDKIQEESNELMNLKTKFEMVEKEKEVLFDMALKDNLTKLFNKKGAESILQKLIAEGEKFTIIYINIDNYNNVLKKNGEKIANDMIINLVDIIKKTVRDRDFIFRISEDKFLIVLRYIDLGISQRVLKRIVDFVKKFNITSDKEYKISISYGLLEYKNQTIEEIFIEARNRMEEMKRKKIELLKKIKENLK